MKDETVWLIQKQMAELFNRDKLTIAFFATVQKEELTEPTVAKFATVQKEELTKKSVCSFFKHTVSDCKQYKV